MSTRFHCLAGAIGFAVVVAAPAHATDFLKAIDDVPLVAGLTEQADPVVFESEQGRVVKTSASGSADYGAVRDFYLTTLPSLGWKQEGRGTGGKLVFAREHERLTLSIEPAAGVKSPLNVIFELVVKLASTKLPE
ncbi:MAG: hypothetical protein Q8R02_13240 [Hyphomonadaceae bacterium]|nr:hypothetical protein [Hyphomonadaceae bacterium]